MRVTSRGQVTIPIEIRDRLGLHPGTEVDFAVHGTAVRVTRARGDRRRATRIAERLRGPAHGGVTTGEIMALTRE